MTDIQSLPYKEKIYLVSNYFDKDKFPDNTAHTFTNVVDPPLYYYDQVSLRLASFPTTDSDIKFSDELLREPLQDVKLNFTLNYTITWEDYNSNVFTIPKQDNIASISVDFGDLNTYAKSDSFSSVEELKNSVNMYLNSYPEYRLTTQNVTQKRFSGQDINGIYMPTQFLAVQDKSFPFLYLSTHDTEPHYKSASVKSIRNSLEDELLDSRITCTYNFEFGTIEFPCLILPIPSGYYTADIKNVQLPKKYDSDAQKQLFYYYLQDRIDKHNVEYFYLSFESPILYFNNKVFNVRGELGGDNEQLYVYLKQLRAYRIANQNEPLLYAHFFEKSKVINKRITLHSSIPLSIPLSLIDNTVHKLDFELRNAVDEENSNIYTAGATIFLIKFFSSSDGSQTKAQQSNF